MKQRFLSLFVARLEKVFRIDNDVMEVKVEPVYENGMKFSGQVFVSGHLLVDLSEEEVIEVVSKYLRKHVDFVKPVTLEFRDEIKTSGRYRWAS